MLCRNFRNLKKFFLTQTIRTRAHIENNTYYTKLNYSAVRIIVHILTVDYSFHNLLTKI